MSRNRLILVTVGVMFSLFMASMEATVIATAMPTIVSQLGGLAVYSWVFSIYMLTSTTVVPLYGKLSDIYGRRPIYAIAMGFFLLGSLLSGLAQSMEQLIAYRALQGLGAGGVLSLAFIIVGDIFTFEQRARIQGVFSSVWGVSSIIGPLLGGFLVEQISWQWVFYVNLLPGVVALALVWFSLPAERSTASTRPAVDYAGALLLSIGVILLLLGLAETSTPRGQGLLVAAVLILALLLWVERRAPDPVLPLRLWRERLFATATLHGLFSGWAVFGTISFVPLFVQAVLGASATAAGTTLTPMMLGWVAASIVSSRALLRMGYRTLALVGMVSLTVGALLLTLINADAPRWLLMVELGLMGVGMGFSVPPFLIAVQSTVQKRDLGTATSTLQFSRSIGGTLGVSVMGVFLSLWLAAGLTSAGLDPAAVALDTLIDPLTQSTTTLDGPLRGALGEAIQGVFVIGLIAAVLGLIATALAPGGRIDQAAEAAKRGRPQPVAPSVEA
jgi:EmrB/QacA subfamily drug resistance transporter